MGIGELLKLSSRNPGPRNRAHSLPDSTAVTFSTAPICQQPGIGTAEPDPPHVGFAKFTIPNPPSMVPVSGL